MTNKPMLSVERKLLVRLCNLNAVGWEDIEPEMKELRALLDQPVDSNELSLGGSLARAASGLINVLDDEAGAWTETEALKRALEDWSMGKPAAQHQGEPVACMPVDRCYDVRAKMIIAFNETKKAGGDLDDALDAAYKSALRYSPNPMTSEQPVPVAVDTERLDFILSKSRTVTTEILPDGYALYVEEGLMGDKIYPHVKASTVGRENRKALQRQAIDLAIAEIRLNVAKS